MRPGGARVVFTTLLALVIMVCFSTQSQAAWSLKKKKKEEPYIAKVGSTIIKLSDFEKAVRRLHTSKRVGKALTEEKSFEKHSFVKYLDELIDDELMVIECERLGVDKDREFTGVMNSYRLNIFLGELRREEITEKVNVSDSDVQAELDKEAAAKETETGTDVEKKEAAPGPHDPASQRKQMITRNLTRARSKVVEEQFFKDLKANARINIKRKALKIFSSEDEKLYTRVLAVVNGEKITALDLLRDIEGMSLHKEELVRDALDRIILHRILDKEAFSRNYEKIPRVKSAIEKYRKKRLTEFFKKKVVLPLIRVEEEEILQYYNSNKDEFNSPDLYNLRMIFVATEEEAASLVNELGRGADFGFLAREKSLDPTKDNMGELGWVPTNRLSEDIARAAANTPEGGLMGPFKMEYGYSIMELLGSRPGALKPLESVKTEIDRMLGRKKFEATYKKYLERLRETVPVEINEEALKKVLIVRPKEG